MFWATLWALVLGFGLSGAVQAFVSKDDMQRVLGDHGPGSIARASGLGMASSSCSYAASAMAKSLFQKGADFVSSMVFMFASTNLVIELGIVLIVLMGWQFAAAEFIGGSIMIVLLAISSAFVLRGSLVERARARLRAGAGAGDHRQTGLEQTPWREKLRSRAAWSDAAGYTIADITMLRKELVIGYGVAGVLSVMVPMDVWNALFLQGHGFWTSLENALVGPLIACISFVCSIGNVPMAAALWQGGISFGGVISFIFADLIALPLLFVYRKYYGTRLMLRLVVWFYVVMVLAALAVEGLFAAVGAIPDDASGLDCRDQLPVELHDVPQHRVPRRVRGHLLVEPEPVERRGNARLRDRSDLLHAGRQGQRAGSSRGPGRRRVLLLRPLSRALRGAHFFLTRRPVGAPSRSSSISPTVRSRRVVPGMGRSCCTMYRLRRPSRCFTTYPAAARSATIPYALRSVMCNEAAMSRNRTPGSSAMHSSTRA